MTHRRILVTAASTRRASLNTPSARAIAAWVDASLVEFDQYCTGRPPT